MKSEIWRECKEFPSYEVSSEGKIRSKSHKKNLKPWPSNGYMYVSISLKKTRITKLVHRLVAKEFVDGNHSLEVNHKDGNKSNNHPSNLEWVTVRENKLHAYRTGLMPKRRTRIITYEMGNLLWLLRFSGLSDTKIGKEIGLSQTSVSKYFKKEI